MDMEKRFMVAVGILLALLWGIVFASQYIKSGNGEMAALLGFACVAITMPVCAFGCALVAWVLAGRK